MAQLVEPDEQRAMPDYPARRLYPLLGRQVMTPKGTGILHQAFDHRAAVALLASPKTLTFFRPEEIADAAQVSPTA